MLLALALAPVLAGCGGADVELEEVPGPPATVPVPSSPDEAPSAATPSGDEAQGEGEATPTPEGEETPAPEESGSAPEAQPDTASGTTEEGGGAAAPEAAPDSPENDQAPPAGSDAEQFEDFCAQNPGAC
jgi:hypothetical protein